MSTITVGTADLRQALLSVAPHASRTPEDSPLYRIHLDVGDQTLSVSATNRFSAALAIVSLEERDDELLEVDLSPTDVKEILALFRGKGSKDDEEIGATLRINVTDEHFTITDSSGLFDGKSLALPRYPTSETFPRIPLVIAAAIRRAGRGVAELHTNGTLLALFKAAATAYGQPLIIEPTGKAATLVISCGESFIGLLMPIRQDEEQAAEEAAWRAAWMRRFTDIEALTVIR